MRARAHTVSASIDKLVIKFPTFADIQRQSGLVEVAANQISLELESTSHDDEHAPIGVEQLAASLSALRQEISQDVQSAYQDAPDADLEASNVRGESSSGVETDAQKGGGGGGAPNPAQGGGQI